MHKEYRFPFNPDGVLPDCRIVKERHVLTTINGDSYQFIVPSNAPFFLKDLTVYHTATGRQLKNDVDYQLTHLFRSAKNTLNKYIYGSITFLNRDLSGEIELDYVTLGGKFTAKDNPLLKRLVSSITDHRQVDWEDIVNVDTVFPPIYHQHPNEEIVDMDTVVEAIEKLTAVVSGTDKPAHHHSIGNIENLRKELDGLVSNQNYINYDPILPFVIPESCQVTLLALPKVKVPTGFSVHVWLSDRVNSQRVVITGWIEPDKDDIDSWISIHAHADNTSIIDDAYGGYSHAGAPHLYLKRNKGDLLGSIVAIEKVIYTERVTNNLDGDYGIEISAAAIGNKANVERYINRTEYEIMMRRLNRVKLNTLLGESVFPII